MLYEAVSKSIGRIVCFGSRSRICGCHVLLLFAITSDLGMLSYKYFAGNMWLTWPVVHVKDTQINVLLKVLVFLKRFHKYSRQFL